MLEDKLELLVITYNRAKFLERTLSQLLTSPFAGCRKTVLDNCSPDETPQVCERYRARFADLRVIRHGKNIGASPNYLRAVELSRAAYTWVLCDDDQFDFTDCADVISVIEAGEVDLIHVWFPGQLGWRRGATTTSAALAKNGSHYFYVLSFVPSLIFKTTLFDSECLAKGYRNVANLYPHFEFINKTTRGDFLIYVSQRMIVTRDNPESLPSGLFWYTVWVNSCRTIEDRQLRRRAVYDLPDAAQSRPLWLKMLASWIVSEKLFYPERVFPEVGQILRGFSPDQLLLFLCISPLLLTPAFAYRLARRIRCRIRNKAYTEANQPFDFFRL